MEIINKMLNAQKTIENSTTEYLKYFDELVKKCIVKLKKTKTWNTLVDDDLEIQIESDLSYVDIIPIHGNMKFQLNHNLGMFETSLKFTINSEEIFFSLKQVGNITISLTIKKSH